MTEHMNDDDLLAIYFVLSSKRKRKRTIWTTNWLLKREQLRHTNLLHELLPYPKDVHTFLRMDEDSYRELLDLVRPSIEKEATVLRSPIDAHQRLTATLRYLATGDTYQDLKFSTYISAQALSNIIPETCTAIYQALSAEYLKVQPHNVMSQGGRERKRKMDALISGDNRKAHASQESCSSAKTPCMAQGSASGDSQQGNACHEFVTVLRDLENTDSTPSIHTHMCELEDVWSHKYPLPLSKFPPKNIKTGNKAYDAIIPDLLNIGYRPLQVIAKGRSGTIVLAQDVREGVEMSESECMPVAIKLLTGKKRKTSANNINEDTSQRDLPDEILIHQRLQHPNIVTLLNTICYQGRLGSVMEFCEVGNLETLLRSHDARFVSESIARRYLYQMHSALEYMHLSGVAHRDLCLQNILLTNDNTVKLTDLSQAVLYSPGDALCLDVVGTAGYQAPEMFFQQGYDPRQTDLWSLGCVLYNMVVGRLPYGRFKTEDEARALKPLSFPPVHVMVLSSQVKELLVGILSYVPGSRFTINRVRNSEWFNTVDNKVQIGSFYLVRQPQKICDGDRERELKQEYEI